MRDLGLRLPLRQPASQTLRSLPSRAPHVLWTRDAIAKCLAIAALDPPRLRRMGGEDLHNPSSSHASEAMRGVQRDDRQAFGDRIATM